MANCNKKSPSASPKPPATIDNVLSMSGGESKDSYSKNSGVQRYIFAEVVVPLLNEALEQVCLPPSHEPVVVAELGCSSGPNSIQSVTHIVQKLRERYPDPASPPPDFQALFNDLPSNDFNNLFQLLSSETGSNFFAAGVPGSFYGRLFPRSSVHTFFSSSSIHWISKIPDVVLDKNSPAFNKGRVWIDGPDDAVAITYKEQAALDLNNFLNARAEELVPGGSLFLCFPARTSPEPNKPFHADGPGEACWRSLNEAWDEVISQGILTEDQRNAFNIPMYFRHLEEVTQAIENCSSVFHMKILKLWNLDTTNSHLFSATDPHLLAKKIFLASKSLFSVLLEEHLGEQASKVLFQHWESVAMKNMMPMIEPYPKNNIVLCILGLMRK